MLVHAHATVLFDLFMMLAKLAYVEKYKKQNTNK